MRRACIPGPSAVSSTALALLLSCSGAPTPRPEATAPTSEALVDAADPCAPGPDQPVPEALTRAYDGLARNARCQPEVLAIMKGVTRALDVGCEYCHVRGDPGAMTERKQISNWMARELVPRLSRKSDGSEVWCSDCHASSGRGVAKILGEPRSEPRAIEWMTAHLTDDFNQADGKRLRCKSCHGDNLGAPGFRRKLILSAALEALPSRFRAVTQKSDEAALPAQPEAGAR